MTSAIVFVIFTLGLWLVSRRARFFTPALGVFSFSVVVSFLGFMGFQFPAVNAPDIENFVQNAYNFSSLGVWITFDPDGSYVWSSVLAVFLLLPGATIFTLHLLVSLFGSLTALYVFKILNFYFSRNVSLYVAIFIGVSPPYVFYSSVLLREAALIFMFVWLVYSSYCLVSSFRLRYFFSTLLSAACLTALHGGFVFVWFGVLYVCFLALARSAAYVSSSLRSLFFSVVLVAVSVSALMFLLSREVGYSKIYSLYQGGISGGVDFLVARVDASFFSQLWQFGALWEYFVVPFFISLASPFLVDFRLFSVYQWAWGAFFIFFFFVLFSVTLVRRNGLVFLVMFYFLIVSYPLFLASLLDVQALRHLYKTSLLVFAFGLAWAIKYSVGFRGGLR